MIETAANKIDAFLREYEEEGELFGPPVWLTPPPWYAFKARSVDKKTNERLRRYGLPPLSRAFRIAFHYQDGQGHEDAGGYLRRKWLVALGFRLDEFEQYYYGRKISRGAGMANASSVEKQIRKHAEEISNVI